MNNPIKTIIIDDELDAREILRFQLKSFPNLNIIQEAHGVTSGVQAIRDTQPDLVFLDIEMQDGTGFDLLNQFEKPNFKVVFVTAHDDFALKAFKFNAVDYVLKPIDKSEIARVVNKVESATNSNFANQISGLLETVKEKKFEKLILNTADGIHVIRVNDIIHLTADGSYVQINMINNEKLMVSKNLKELEEMLDETHFFRTHQSHIINLHFVKKLVKESGGFIEMKDGEQVPLARRKKDLFLEKLANA